MFETVKDHGERIASLEEKDLVREELDRQHEERLKKLEDNSLRMENTIMSENRETRNTFTEQTKKLFDIVETAMGISNTRTTQSHEYKMLKWNTLSTIFLKWSAGIFGLLGSGGLLYVALMQLFGE